MVSVKGVIQLWFIGGLVGCGASNEPSISSPDRANFPDGGSDGSNDSSASSSNNEFSPDGILGHDRLGRALRDKLDHLPPNSAALESLLGVGRECRRADSKEIFVIEEFSKRTGGIQQVVSSELPRVVVTGCNDNPKAADGALKSASLMLAMTSDNKKRPPDNPLMDDEVSVMALDEITGLYNFYKFLPASFTRFEKMPDGTVKEVIKTPGNAVTTRTAKDGVCYKCHALEEPILAALTHPWDGWITDALPVMHRIDWKGETRAILEAAGALGAGASSISVASQLERTVRIGLEASIQGEGRPETGYGHSVLTGRRPGGLSGLLRSVFCEVTVNLVSATKTSFPSEVVMDPEALEATPVELLKIRPPKDDEGEYIPHLFPVRSEADKTVEAFLTKEGYLTSNVALAIRLLDPLNDIFSKARCDVHQEVTKNLPKSPNDVSQHIRSTVLATTQRGTTYGTAHFNYLTALLDPNTDPATIEKLRHHYIDEAFRQAVTDAHRLVDSAVGHKELLSRLKERQRRAKALFPGNSHPLPPFDRTIPSEFAP